MCTESEQTITAIQTNYRSRAVLFSQLTPTIEQTHEFHEGGTG